VAGKVCRPVLLFRQPPSVALLEVDRPDASIGTARQVPTVSSTVVYCIAPPIEAARLIFLLDSRVYHLSWPNRSEPPPLRPPVAKFDLRSENPRVGGYPGELAWRLILAKLGRVPPTANFTFPRPSAFSPPWRARLGGKARRTGRG
jgi:hypothetical protein